MTLPELAARCGITVDLTPELWVKSITFAKMRQATNDYCPPDQQRGNLRNVIGHAIGLISELLLEQLSGKKVCLFNPNGGAAQAGAEITLDDGSLIDAKSYRFKFDSQGRQRHKNFCINWSKHQEVCTAYFCVLTPWLGKRAIVARLVPYADVSKASWFCYRIGSSGTPSLNLPIDTFIRRYCLPYPRELETEVFTSKDFELVTPV